MLKRKIIRNTIFSGLASSINGLVGFLILPFIISKIGVIQYGLVGIANIFSMSGYASLLEMGFQGTISKYISEYLAKNDRNKVNSIIISTLAFFLMLSLIIFWAGLFTSRFIVFQILSLPLEFKSEFVNILNIIFFSYFIQLPMIVFSGVLEGLQRFDIIKTTQIIITIATAVTILLFLNIYPTYKLVIIATILWMCFQMVIYLIFIKILLPEIVFDRKYLSIHTFKELWGMTKFLSIGKLSSLTYHNLPRIIISVFLGPAVMTTFEVIMRLPRFLKNALGFINTSILPAASELSARNDNSRINQLFLKGIKYQAFFIFPVTTVLMYFAKDFLQLWVGKEFISYYYLLQISLMMDILAPLINYGASIMLGINYKINKITYISIITTLTTLLIYLITVILGKGGIEEIIIGYIAGTLLVVPGYLYLFQKAFNISIYHFLKEISRLLIPFIPLIGVFFIFEHYLHYQVKSFTLFFIYVILWCLLYWSFTLNFIFTTDDRKNLSPSMILRSLLFLK